MIGAVMGESKFSTADHILAVKGDRRDDKNYVDVANDAKLWGIISVQGAIKKHVFLRTNHTGAWMSVHVTTVTITVLTALEFCDFYVLNIKLTPLTFKINTTVSCRPFWCVTCLSTATEVASLYATMIYITRSYTSPDKPFPLTAYMANL